jgi:hypothetical protein
MTKESLPKCSQTLQERIARAPSKTVHLLLRVSEVGQTQRAAIEQAGFAVRHQTTLVPCFAVSGPGVALQTLLQETWLVSVEEDGLVQTL